MRRIVVAVAASAALSLVAVAGASAAGPSIDPKNNNNGTWACGGLDAGAPVPPNHCINVRSRGNTGVVKVFSPDDRWPQESISTDPKTDGRPCPHDPAALDGTWWSPLPGLWVCHHRP